MNKYFYIITTLFLSFSISTTIAQESEKKYKYTLGGILNFQTSNYNNPNVTNLTADESEVRSSKNSAFNSTVYAGIKLSNKRQVGIIGLFEHNNYHQLFYNTDTSTAVKKTTNIKYGIGVFYRQLFNLNSNFKLYSQPRVLISKQNDKLTYNPLESDGKVLKTIIYNFDIAFGAQFNIFKNCNILVELWNIQYSSSTLDKVSYTLEKSTLDFSFNFRDIKVGAEYIF